MAGVDAIAATSEAIVSLLGGTAKDDPDYSTVNVQQYRSDDLQTLLSDQTAATISVYLHRVSVSPARHNIPFKTGVHGESYPPAIPLDLYYLVTAWAGTAISQQQLLGWAIRVLEDTPVLTSALLNQVVDGGFAPAETVELVWAPLTMQEEWDLWQVAQTNQQPSASYVARTVAIESSRALPDYALVQSTGFDYGGMP
jgi:hypothetical protein